MLKPIGALWKKKSAAGVGYLSGKIEADKLREIFPEITKDFDVLVFTNEKQHDKQPDFRIQLSIPDADVPAKGEAMTAFDEHRNKDINF